MYLRRFFIFFLIFFVFFFFFNDTATTEIYTLSLHDALPIAAATSCRSATPSENSPWLVPCFEEVPRVLNLSTARSARAGSRKAALRNTWLSIMPPCVGSGCRQISVAAAGRCAGRASSPTRLSPSEVRRVTGCRSAGSTVPGLISLTCAASSVSPAAVAGCGPTRPALPARIVPVPPLVRVMGIGRPYHHVRGPRHDLLVAAGAPIHLGGRGTGHLPDHPVPVRPRLGLLGTEPDRRRIRGTPGTVGRPASAAPGSAARLARHVGGKAAGLTGAHGRHCKASLPGF